jgi:hypothetical protein
MIFYLSQTPPSLLKPPSSHLSELVDTFGSLNINDKGTTRALNSQA